MRPINLLPPEQAEKAKRRRGALFGVFLAVAFLALLAFFTFLKIAQRTAAEDAVIAQQLTNDNLQRDINSLGEARQARDDYRRGEQQITAALAIDVEWGRMLNDIGRVIPDRVWLTSLSATASPPPEDEPIPSYGALAFGGSAFDYPDAATWFRTVDSVEWPAVGGGWVSSINTITAGDFLIVQFSSSASITGAALSDRALDRVPEIPE